MNEYRNLSNEVLQELFYKSRIAVNNLSPLMAKNDRAYLVKRHKDISAEILRRGTAYLN